MNSSDRDRSEDPSPLTAVTAKTIANSLAPAADGYCTCDGPDHNRLLAASCGRAEHREAASRWIAELTATPAVSVSGAAREATEAQVQAAEKAYRAYAADPDWRLDGAFHAVADAVVAAGPVEPGAWKVEITEAMGKPSKARIFRDGVLLWTGTQPDLNVAAGPVDVELAAVVAERDALKRGGAELGKMLKWQHDAVLDATGLHDLIDEDGDGDWAGVWEGLAELKPRCDQLSAEVTRLRSENLDHRMSTRLVPIADLEAAWRVGSRHMARADRAEATLAKVADEIRRVRDAGTISVIGPRFDWSARTSLSIGDVLDLLAAILDADPAPEPQAGLQTGPERGAKRWQGILTRWLVSSDMSVPLDFEGNQIPERLRIILERAGLTPDETVRVSTTPTPALPCEPEATQTAPQSDVCCCRGLLHDKGCVVQAAWDSRRAKEAAEATQTGGEVR